MSGSDSSESLTSMYVRPVTVYKGCWQLPTAEKMLCTVSGQQRKSNSILGLLWLNKVTLLHRSRRWLRGTDVMVFMKASHCGWMSLWEPSSCPGNWSWQSSPPTRGSAGGCSCLCLGLWHRSGCYCQDKINEGLHSKIQHMNIYSISVTTLMQICWLYTRLYTATTKPRPFLNDWLIFLCHSWDNIQQIYDRAVKQDLLLKNINYCINCTYIQHIYKMYYNPARGNLVRLDTF